jgi:hypothetical protein
MVSHSHTTLLRVLWICIGLSVLVGIAFLITHFIKGKSSLPNSPLSVVYAISNPSGAIWYEIHAGAITTYPALPGEQIAGIGHSLRATFVLGVGGTSSTIYSYSTTTKTYTAEYHAPGILKHLAVDPDGLYASFVAPATSTASTSEIQLLDLSSKKVMTLGSGVNAVMMGRSGTHGAAGAHVVNLPNSGYLSVVYLEGTTIEAQTLHNSTWSPKTLVYQSQKPFTTDSALVTDGMNSIGFVEPLLSYGELWHVSTLSPFTASPVTLYPHVQGTGLAIEENTLAGMTVQPAGSTKGAKTASLQISTLVPQSGGAATSTLMLPLLGTEAHPPSFISSIPAL